MIERDDCLVPSPFGSRTRKPGCNPSSLIRTRIRGVSPLKYELISLVHYIRFLPAKHIPRIVGGQKCCRFVVKNPRIIGGNVRNTYKLAPLVSRACDRQIVMIKEGLRDHRREMIIFRRRRGIPC